MPPSTYVGFENRIPNSKKYPVEEKTKRDKWKIWRNKRDCFFFFLSFNVTVCVSLDSFLN
jgi:hypothetical protein